MDFLGFFCLGVFIGSLLSLGLGFIASLSDFKKAVTTCIAAAFGGVLFTFLEWLTQSSTRGVFAYPVGLLVAILWYYTRFATGNVRSPKPADKILGWLHLLAAAILSLMAAALFLPPAFREMASQNTPMTTLRSSPSSVGAP